MELKPGSYSTGTLRRFDRIKAMAAALTGVAFPEDAVVIADAEAWVEQNIEGGKPFGYLEADLLIDALNEALDKHCPEGYYWGNHPDDPADLGVWFYIV